MSKPASTAKSRARDFQTLRRKSAGSTKRPSGTSPEPADVEPIAPRLDLAADFQARIRANLRELLSRDGRGIVDIAEATWLTLSRSAASRKLNRLTAVEGPDKSLWTTFEYHHAAALAEALGVDPAEFYAAR